MTQADLSKLSLWLIGSLIANALFVGLLIGGGIAKQRAPSPLVQSDERQIARSIHDALPKEARAPVRRQFQQAFRNTQPQRREIRRLRQELRRLMLADSYDHDAVAAVFAELRAADSAMRADLHEQLVIQLGELSPEQRQAVLRDLASGGARRTRRNDGQRRRDRQPPPPPPEN